ncbi:hypothetical protein [Streptomyces sp. bgisy153]|uniref:hypothetical protein n=1 Tax=Streptomyces sp. bgisy153 TaxID=3413793 RepID=UPI003D72E653
MTVLTPRARLVADLVAPLQDTTRPGDAADSDLAGLAPQLSSLIEAAHRRVRGLRAVSVEFTGPGPGAAVPCAALRSDSGTAETADFVNLWCLALEAVEGRPRSLPEAFALVETPLEERIQRAYPGVQLGAAPAAGPHDEYTLYARGEDPVRQLAELLRASVAAWPEPDWPAQICREKFLTEAFRAHTEGRADDLRRLLEDFADPGTTD